MPDVTEKVSPGGDDVPRDVGTRPANEDVGRSRPANQEPGNAVDASQGIPRVAGRSGGTRVCSYAKGGVCAIHGPGAKLRWKPVTTGNGDKWDKTKKYFYVCDESIRDRKLKKTRLSFGPVTSPRVGLARNLGENL